MQQATENITTNGKNFDHVLLNALFQLIECGEALDELNVTPFSRKKKRKKIYELIDELQKSTSFYEPIWNIDQTATLQFCKAQKEWSEMMIDVSPEMRVQILEMAKLAKEKPAHFNSIAVAMGCGIITVKGDR